MSFFRSHAGFNITGDKIQLVEIDYKEEASDQTGFYLENVDEEFFTEFLDLNFSETKIINILQNSFNEIILRKPLITNNVSFSFPHNFFKIFSLPFDSGITSNDLKDHLKWEVSLLYPDYEPEAFILRHVENQNESTGKVKHAIVFAALKRYLKVIHKFCVRNNLVLRNVDNAHIAANSLLIHLSETNEVTSILLDEKSFSVSLMKGKKTGYFKSFQIESIAEFIDKIGVELNSINKHNGAESERTVYISGNFISENLLSKLKETSGCEFRLLNPFTKLKTSSSLNAEELLNKKAHSFSSAAGIALRLV